VAELEALGTTESPVHPERVDLRDAAIERAHRIGAEIDGPLVANIVEGERLPSCRENGCTSWGSIL